MPKHYNIDFKKTADDLNVPLKILENRKKKLEYNSFISSRILDIYLNSNKIYGSLKITAELRKEGIKISQKTVLAFMQILSLGF